MAKTRNGVIAALDIGTSKVVCFVARVDGQGLRVVGIGHQPSMGMRSGNIVDMEAATRAISSAVSMSTSMERAVALPVWCATTSCTRSDAAISSGRGRSAWVRLKARRASNSTSGE